MNVDLFTLFAYLLEQSAELLVGASAVSLPLPHNDSEPCVQIDELFFIRVGGGRGRFHGGGGEGREAEGERREIGTGRGEIEVGVGGVRCRERGEGKYEGERKER